MARARNIKPAFFLNTDLSEISAIGRLAFIGLWTIADFRGCVECNLKKIKAQILPYDDCDMEALMINLEQFRFIRMYSILGKKYIKILNFEKHQNPHKNERDAGSEIPDMPNDVELAFHNNDLHKDETKTELIPIKSEAIALNPSSLIPDSLNLIPDSSLPIPETLIYSVAKATGGEPPNPSGSFPKVQKARVTDPSEIIFGYGVPLLVNAGTLEKQARSFLGGLRKTHGDDVLVDKLRECLKAKPLQPLEWLAAALPPPSSAAKPNAQEALEASNAAIAERFLNKGKTNATH